MAGDHLAQNAEVAIGATGAVIATDQFLKAVDQDHEDKTAHIVKGSIGAAIAIGAWEMYKQQEEKGGRRSSSISRSRSRSANRSRSRPRSSGRDRSRSSERVKHHKRRMLEEIIGAYALGKELLGDKHHHIAHLVGEALGATALVKDVTERNRIEEEERHRH
ncbi:hypothetical protein BKA61DRAFT_574283 [Leptodontidium sp. MPI-SDFR-AT-0119]|nr:hypothetical protein BKA61DRAFT_574283 [Leptodontidium sp. MPI-SDFR-AT-0119]